MAEKFIPSTAEGLTWSIDVWRSANTGEVNALAREGVLETNERGFKTFEFSFGESRTLRFISDDKRLTKAAKVRLIAKLESQLRDRGMIA